MTTRKSTNILPVEFRCISALFLLSLPAIVQAQFTFTTNNGAVTITGYSGPGGEVIIPGTINGYPVTSIVGGGPGSIFGSVSMTNVIIPDTVTNIGQSAFDGCNLTNIVIPGSVTSIGNDAFEYCTELSSVTLNNGVISIGENAFRDCTCLKGITIPDTVTNIGDFAFADCASLTNVTIPGSVSSIGGGPFGNCASLTNISVAAANPTYRSTNGIVFDTAYHTLVQYPAGLRSSAYSIPNTVTSIGCAAFYFCANLTNVAIPASVKGIGAFAFTSCSSLTTIVIPNGVTNIGAGVFEGCARVTSVTIPASVTSIGEYAFGSCGSLTFACFQGNAPPGVGNAFNGDPTSIYYPAGTTGWGATFDGAPAVLWNPQAMAFITAGNQFGFSITGPTNLAIVVEACTNLASPVWLPVFTNTLSASGTSSFTDPQHANFPNRYYRFSAP